MDAQPTLNTLNEPDPTWVDLLRGLSRCGRLAQRALTSQLDSRLSSSQAALLWTCREMESQDASQLELARRMGMSPAQISGLVEELRRRDLLTSERSPNDRRRQTWQLTDTGRQLVRSLDAQFEVWSTVCRDQFGDAMLDEMSRGIQSLAAFLDRLPDAPLDVDTHRRGAAA